jgi:glutathione S-transferase
MILLYQFEPGLNIPNPSNFCMKVETYLKMAKLPYEAISNNNWSKAPTRKLPCIEDNHKLVWDSQKIIEYLKDEYGNAVDAHLTNEQLAIGYAAQAIAEDRLIYCLMKDRYYVDDSRKAILDHWSRAFIPDHLRVFRPLIKSLIKKSMKDTLKHQWQGYVRYPEDEMFEFGRRDFKALSDILGDKPYFLGDRPTSPDAGIHAIIANTIAFPTESPLKAIGREFDNIVAYHERMMSEFYGTDYKSADAPKSEKRPILRSLLINNDNWAAIRGMVDKSSAHKNTDA